MTNAGIPVELWGHHGDLKYWEAQKRYMKTDTPRLLSVSRVAIDPPKTLVPDARIEFELAEMAEEMKMAEDKQTPVFVGVPTGAFAWS